jgi:hypothetical protein
MDNFERSLMIGLIKELPPSDQALITTVLNGLDKIHHEHGIQIALMEILEPYIYKQEPRTSTFFMSKARELMMNGEMEAEQIARAAICLNLYLIYRTIEGKIK